jgi:hypothetical protein
VYGFSASYQDTFVVDLLYVGDCETTSAQGSCESIFQVSLTNAAAMTTIQTLITPTQVPTNETVIVMRR